MGNDLRPACLTFIDGVATMDVLQRGRRLNLAKGGELSMLRVLRWMAAKSVSRGSWISLPTFYIRRLGPGIILQANYR
jgi:hypothetical protein